MCDEYQRTNDSFVLMEIATMLVGRRLPWEVCGNLFKMSLGKGGCRGMCAATSPKMLLEDRLMIIGRLGEGRLPRDVRGN